jgi:hypothetical protein
VDAEEFREKAANLQAKLGGRYDLRRYFCEDGELFHASGRTYALSNQWSVNTISIVDQLIALMPSGTATYSKASESPMAEVCHTASLSLIASFGA